MNYFKKANDYYNNHYYRFAIENYQKAIKNKDNEVASLHNLALCFIKLKKYNRAIPLLKVAISKKREGTYLYNLAYCYLMLKDFKKALLYCNTAWALSPNCTSCEKLINFILKTYKHDKKFM